jgi:peptidoglycan hydrolase-like protein with peptidoglycan-binding domain
MAIGSFGLQGAGLLGGASLRGAAKLGGVVGRYPSISGGAMAFAVIFSFVAANALWYQPGIHPSPFFRTRDPAAPYALAGRKPFFSSRTEPADTTTFRIERPDDVASVIQSGAAAPVTLVSQVQSELVRRGLYNGAADGVIGPRTTAAILFFEESAGLKQTGEPSPQLLAALKAGGAPAAPAAPAASAGVAVPLEKPPVDVTSKAALADPVAAAILNSDREVRTASVTPARKPVPDAVANVNMVMQIQKGLSNIAYSNVSIDGVAGETTRTAILHFQKHYRLPETGEADSTVLKKLREIGAL